MCGSLLGVDIGMAQTKTKQKQTKQCQTNCIQFHRSYQVFLSALDHHRSINSGGR
jgi:hypothetical protein